jgi:hypothetical protein
MITERGETHQPASVAVSMSNAPVLTQVTNLHSNISGSPAEMSYGLRSQSALFPLNQVERRVDTSYDTQDDGDETPHYGDGAMPPVMEKEVSSASVSGATTATASSPVTLATIAGKSAGTSQSVPRTGSKPSPYTNVPFFHSKDKPNG